jgi:AAA family ATP:ADP antiporter
MLLFTMTSTFLSVEQLRIVSGLSTEADKRVASQATVTFFANIVTLVTQLFLTGHILTRLGLLFGLLLLPLITAAGFSTLAVTSAPLAFLVFAVARRGMHYAVDRPTREVLYTILGPDEKYKSKSFVDIVVYRVGDLAAIWTEPHLKKTAAIGAGVAVGLSLVWAGAGAALNAMNKRISRR